MLLLYVHLSFATIFLLCSLRHSYRFKLHHAVLFSFGSFVMHLDEMTCIWRHRLHQARSSNVNTHFRDEAKRGLQRWSEWSVQSDPHISDKTAHLILFSLICSGLQGVGVVMEISSCTEPQRKTVYPRDEGAGSGEEVLGLNPCFTLCSLCDIVQRTWPLCASVISSN